MCKFVFDMYQFYIVEYDNFQTICSEKEDPYGLIGEFIRLRFDPTVCSRKAMQKFLDDHIPMKKGSHHFHRVTRYIIKYVEQYSDMLVGSEKEEISEKLGILKQLSKREKVSNEFFITMYQIGIFIKTRYCSSQKEDKIHKNKGTAGDPVTFSSSISNPSSISSFFPASIKSYSVDSKNNSPNNNCSLSRHSTITNDNGRNFTTQWDSTSLTTSSGVSNSRDTTRGSTESSADNVILYGRSGVDDDSTYYEGNYTKEMTGEEEREVLINYGKDNTKKKRKRVTQYEHKREKKRRNTSTGLIGTFASIISTFFSTH